VTLDALPADVGRFHAQYGRPRLQGLDGQLGEQLGPWVGDRKN